MYWSSPVTLRFTTLTLILIKDVDVQRSAKGIFNISSLNLQDDIFHVFLLTIDVKKLSSAAQIKHLTIFALYFGEFFFSLNHPKFNQ